MDTQTVTSVVAVSGLAFPSGRQPAWARMIAVGFANLCYFITFVKQGPKQRSRTALLKGHSSADAEVVV
jgi:hypothetical protein